MSVNHVVGLAYGVPLSLEDEKILNREENAEVDALYDDGYIWYTAPITGNGPDFFGLIIKRVGDYDDEKLIKLDDVEVELEELVRYEEKYNEILLPLLKRKFDPRLYLFSMWT